MLKNKVPILEVINLNTYFFTEDGNEKAVDGVNFSVYPGKVMSLVVESSCRKRVTFLSIMRLIGIPGIEIDWEMLLESQELQ